jgi:phage terminase large subunit
MGTNLLDRYIGAAREAGCPPDQIEFFIRSGIVLQPKQLRFAAMARVCDALDGPTAVGYGGARGGGKSHASVAILCDDCNRYPGLKVLFLRKILKGARESFNDLRGRIMRGIPHTYKIAEGIIEFGNGSKIILGHFRNENDIDAYLGLEYDVICIEEATTLSASKQRAIRTCLRTSKEGWRPREYKTTNPGGVGHGDFKQTFIAPFRRGQETDTRFVPATVDDNGFVNTDYVKTLDSLIGWQKDAWRYGDWDIAAGQFFTNWSEQHHVIPSEGFKIMPGWRSWLAFDYGFTHFTACGLFTEDGDGNRFLVDSHGERKKLPAWHAPRIHSMLERNGLNAKNLRKLVAGHDMFAQRGTEKTLAETYAELGLPFEPADIDRINGAGAILTGFGDPRPDAGDAVAEPKLFILDRNARTIATIPAMIHDPHRPEDVLKVDCDEDGEGGDDFYDMFRYGQMVDAPEPPNLTPFKIRV